MAFINSGYFFWVMVIDISARIHLSKMDDYKTLLCFNINIVPFENQYNSKRIKKRNY